LKACFFIGLFIIVAGYFLFSRNHGKENPEKAIEQKLLMQIDSFSAITNQFRVEAQKHSPDEKRLQHLFKVTRLAYKKFEWAAEYFTQTVTRVVNGPPVTEVEMSGQRVINPEGLQVIEGFLFPKFSPSKKHDLVKQLQLLQTNCDQYKAYFQNIAIYNWQVFDACKLEVFRIITLGITGFDNFLSLNSMSECATSLQSLQAVLANYGGIESSDNPAEKITPAIRYLIKNNSFNSFNRAEFIISYGNEITIVITRLQKKLNMPVVKYNRLLNQDAATLFDSNAFNINAFGPGSPYLPTNQRIALGKKLFFDPVLSGDQTRSCSSCHQPGKAFTDGLTKNVAINGKRPLKRNTPGLINAALQPFQFYDERVNTLEEQVANVVQNKDEMHGSLQKAISKLWGEKTYRELFSEAYPKTRRNGIDSFEIMNALSSYVRSLTFFNSRFDDYMRGNKSAMNASEVNGFNLFMGKAKCGTCHYMPLFNGALPPDYIKMDAEVVGVPGNKYSTFIDTDKGRFNILNFPTLKFGFKTPTLRNVALTAPYMHNGVFSNLEEVIDFYNKGGGSGMGIKIGNQTLSPDKLRLTKKETNELIAFIKTLNSN
jgi:cytochrome c peroxidase